MNQSSSRTPGFTLIEMMVTVAVLAILMAIAVPSFTNVMRRSDVTSATNALLADISYARSEAANRHTTVSICPSSNGTSCTDDTAYETGWIVYTYEAGKAVSNTDYVSGDATNLLLRTTQGRSGVSIQAKSAVVISFGQQGQLKPESTTLAFEVCYRPNGETGTGSSTTAVPGTSLAVSGSGSVSTGKLGVKTGCTPS
jgi:type IV fimbrial biogenesis protein FimT